MFSNSKLGKTINKVNSFINELNKGVEEEKKLQEELESKLVVVEDNIKVGTNLVSGLTKATRGE